MGEEETVDIVIVGGGICGLSLAVGLQKKGVTRFLVLEKFETLRSAGAALAVLTNGWRALEQLGIANKLRVSSPFSIQRAVDIDLDSGKQREGPVSYGEARAVKRTDLITALADELPPESIRFGCEVISVKKATSTSTIVQLSNGNSIRAKVVIGCDGSNSVIDNFLELNPKKVFSMCGIRGFTYYPQGHNFSPDFVRIRSGGTLSGRAAIDDKLVFWFVATQFCPTDSRVAKDPNLIKQFALEAIKDFPEERVETIRNCDITSLTLTHLRYRAPWDLLFHKFRKGNVTVAGDAMHVMGPFLGQGGSAAIEDAVVLARCLSSRIKIDDMGVTMVGRKEVEEALDEYVKERRMRIVRLSTQTYLTGSLLQTCSSSSPSIVSFITKMCIIVVMIMMFRDPAHHTRYECGQL